MKLTIGMATHDDFHGVYFTVQALRAYHGSDVNFQKDVQLVIVDNAPDSNHGKMLSALAGKVQSGFARVDYVPYTEAQGTSPARNRVFTEAKGEYVLCMDSHVLLAPGALKALLAYYDANPDTHDLISGPMVHDSLTFEQSHFDNNWRGGMWGTWGISWECKCGDGIRFAVNEGANNTAVYRALTFENIPVSSCHYCANALPTLSFGGHEGNLMALGYKPSTAKEDAFEIPGMGLGLFTCRRDAWLGFNEHAREFGGEELYIHEKYRQHGHKAICLPALRWIHRFGRPDGLTYRATHWGKVRNYVLEFNELGFDLEPIRKHFVDELKVIKPAAWDLLVEDAATLVDEPACNTCGAKAQATQAASINEAYEAIRAIPRDLNEHMPKLKELADMCPRVCEVSNRFESAIAFLASTAKELELHNTETSKGLQQLAELRLKEPDPPQIMVTSSKPSNLATINECDLLFIDSEHTYAHLTDELTKFAPKVKRFIAVHDTQIHGKTGTDGGPGLLDALKDYMRANPEWSVVYHTNDQYGLTVIGRLKEDKPKHPPLVTMAANLAKALAAHVAGGSEHVTAEQLEERLEICTMCDQRADGRCTQCGCVLSIKAPLATADCDLGRWPRLTQLEGGDA